MRVMAYGGYYRGVIKSASKRLPVNRGIRLHLALINNLNRHLKKVLKREARKNGRTFEGLLPF